MHRFPIEAGHCRIWLRWQGPLLPADGLLSLCSVHEHAQQAITVQEPHCGCWWAAQLGPHVTRLPRGSRLARVKPAESSHRAITYGT